MWNRKELKGFAKSGVKRNYWKTVLTAFLMAAFTGGLYGDGYCCCRNACRCCTL